jgi:dihydroneopterin aldolase
MYTVFVRGIEAYAYHGVPAHERAVGHRYLVDVEMEVSGTADRSDEVSDTVDYAAAGQIVQSVLSDSPCKTVEHLASEILDRLFAMSPLIVEATATVEKPLPPMPVIAEAAGVRLTRGRARERR